MEYKLLEEKDLDLMLKFIDDENTKYNLQELSKFIHNDNSYGFIAKNDNKVIGFAFGYNLLKPDGRNIFYLHSIDIMCDYQGKGIGTGLLSHICNFAKNIGCYKMFLITNRSNIPACKCYKKVGGVNKADDEIIYTYNLEQE